MKKVSLVLIILFLIVAPALAQIPTPRQEVLNAQRARPNDPWPRGRGHVVLAIPGSLEIQKSYHEPGGSFSPEFRSFGVSLWVTDQSGAIQSTSDNIAITDLKQRFVWHPGELTPSILTDTAEYQTEWSLGPDEGASRLSLKVHAAAGHKMMLVARSVGPAGARLDSLAWRDGKLRINGRYSLAISPAAAAVYVGAEGPEGWTTAPGPSSECRGNDGWCYARFELSGAGEFTVKISDAFWRPVRKLPAADTRSGLAVDLPDPRFMDSLNAQVAHLLMSTVEGQTRPGEPNNYPLAWLRDGAYQVVSIARAGRLDAARELVRYFAEKDFFGGFGAEGDAPGLSLWALEEVAERTHRRDFDDFLWPAVHRKAEFILGMMTTQQPIERIFAGMLVPVNRARPDDYEVAKPAQNGLLMGRMDNHHPAFFVTAVDYHGLALAADFADRVGATADAQRWRHAAGELREAWNRNYQPSEPNERTFMSGLWPTWVAAPSRAAYHAGLDQKWNAMWDDQAGFRETPLWTYFTFATAHQYLFCDQPDRTWQTLNWFWDHQPSPGLYSWWEGKGEENAFHEWEYVRGWVKPIHVTPHYWAAAECLLLQIDMLTYVDESGEKPEIVLGGGVPAAWCLHPMHVRGVVTSRGQVDWDWDGHAIAVKVHGPHTLVRLGTAFPKGAPVRVEFASGS